jgi:hypothetical protein
MGNIARVKALEEQARDTNVPAERRIEAIKALGRMARRGKPEANEALRTIVRSCPEIWAKDKASGELIGV